MRVAVELLRIRWRVLPAVSARVRRLRGLRRLRPAAFPAGVPAAAPRPRAPRRPPRPPRTAGAAGAARFHPPRRRRLYEPSLRDPARLPSTYSAWMRFNEEKSDGGSPCVCSTCLRRRMGRIRRWRRTQQRGLQWPDLCNQSEQARQRTDRMMQWRWVGPQTEGGSGLAPPSVDAPNHMRRRRRMRTTKARRRRRGRSVGRG